MALMDRNTVENLVILIAGILLFNGVINIPSMGTILRDHPFYIIAGAIVLLITKDKIAGKLGGR